MGEVGCRTNSAWMHNTQDPQAMVNGLEKRANEEEVEREVVEV